MEQLGSVPCRSQLDSILDSILDSMKEWPPMLIAMAALFALLVPGNADTKGGGGTPFLFPRSDRFDDDFLATSAANVGGKVVLQDGEMRSLQLYSPPLKIEFRVMSDGNDARFGCCGAEQILFNWESLPSQLRIDGGPASGRHIDGKGLLPAGRFVTVREVVTDDQLDILVDGEPRGRWFGDFKGKKAPIRVFSVEFSTLIVESIHIEPLAADAKGRSSAAVAPLPPESGLFKKSDRFDDDFLCVRGVPYDGGIVVRDGIVESVSQYRVPIEITYRVKTDVDNIRLGYGAWQIVFDWEHDPDQLRVELGPCGGQHVPKMGRIAPGEFATIRQIVREDGMELFVDDGLRGKWKGDYRGFSAPVQLFTHGSLLTVDSIHVKSLAETR